MKYTFLTLLCLFFMTAAQSQDNKYNIVFKPNQTTLEEPQKKEINFIASRLMEGESIMLYPLAYDSISDIYRFTNSSKVQAQAIADYAKSIGFITTGFPRNFPSGYSGMSIGVGLRFTQTPLASNSFGLFPEKPSQFFIINPLRDTMIIGNEGTKLLFKAGSLLSNKQVQIELKEFYQLGDYIKSGLPTVSNGQMLQTGGSIYLNATENDASKKTVGINQNLDIQADFTLGKNDTSMQIFIKDPSSKAFNWMLAGRRISKTSYEITETVVDAEGRIISEETFHSKEAWEKHLADKEKKRKEAAKAEAIKAETSQKMDSKLKIYNLGYINCDKFYDEPTMPLMVSADSKHNAQYYVVYTDIRGVMKGETNSGTVQFGSVAKNREAVLIAVSIVDKQAYFFKCKIGLGGKLEKKIALNPIEDNLLNQELALLK